MKHKLIVGTGFIGVLLVCAVRAFPSGTEGRIYKPIPAQEKELEIDHGLRKVDFLKGERHSEDVIKAEQDGALGAITLKVVDQTGHVVSNATVQGGFYNHGKSGYGFKKTVGANGLVELKNRCVGDMHFTIEKDGYYKTSYTYRFLKAWHDCAKNGRWIPWNPTVEVILKRKVNPVAMYCKKVTVNIPEKEKDFGFDCMARDLVRPHGNGRIADFYLNYSLVYDTNNVWNATNHLTFTFGPHDGGVIMQADATSQMRTLYSAPDGGYTNQITFFLKSIDQMHQTKKVFEGGEYIIFRSRSEIDRQGNVTNAYFGKILGRSFWYGEKSKDGVGGRVIFSYYFNPTPNDRNLEFDGKNNLFKPDWRDTSWPREP
jgi:hypothetical protein